MSAETVTVKERKKEEEEEEKEEEEEDFLFVCLFVWFLNVLVNY